MRYFLGKPASVRHPCFSFLLKRGNPWASVLRAQFCEKCAMFGESLVAVFQARDHDFLRSSTVVAE